MAHLSRDFVLLVVFVLRSTFQNISNYCFRGKHSSVRIFETSLNETQHYLKAKNTSTLLAASSNGAGARHRMMTSQDGDATQNEQTHNIDFDSSFEWNSIRRTAERASTPATTNLGRFLANLIFWPAHANDNFLSTL